MLSQHAQNLSRRHECSNSNSNSSSSSSSSSRRTKRRSSLLVLRQTKTLFQCFDSKSKTKKKMHLEERQRPSSTSSATTGVLPETSSISLTSTDDSFEEEWNQLNPHHPSPLKFLPKSFQDNDDGDVEIEDLIHDDANDFSTEDEELLASLTVPIIQHENDRDDQKNGKQKSSNTTSSTKKEKVKLHEQEAISEDEDEEEEGELAFKWDGQNFIPYVRMTGQDEQQPQNAPLPWLLPPFEEVNHAVTFYPHCKTSTNTTTEDSDDTIIPATQELSPITPKALRTQEEKGEDDIIVIVNSSHGFEKEEEEEEEEELFKDLEEKEEDCDTVTTDDAIVAQDEAVHTFVAVTTDTTSSIASVVDVDDEDDIGDDVIIVYNQTGRVVVKLKPSSSTASSSSMPPALVSPSISSSPSPPRVLNVVILYMSIGIIINIVCNNWEYCTATGKTIFTITTEKGGMTKTSLQSCFDTIKNIVLPTNIIKNDDDNDGSNGHNVRRMIVSWISDANVLVSSLKSS